MIIVMQRGSSSHDVQEIVRRVEGLGFRAHISQGVERTIIGVIGDERALAVGTVEIWPGVERVLPILKPFKLASRELQPSDTLVPVGGVTIGGQTLVVMAGPCAVESRAQLQETALAVKEAGARILRGGAFKPRTSPYSFQGLGEKGLELLAEIGEEIAMPVVTEALAPQDVPLVSRYAQMLQIGARNMQNFPLLHAVGEARRPVLLKRGMSATLEELLMAAEYILVHGNHQVLLCERGIRTFETYTRNTFDVNAIPALKQLTHLPVIGDPSHGTGRWALVSPVARATIAAGADGLLVEVHPRPEEAASDGAQSLTPENFARLMGEVRRIAEAVGRNL